MTCSAGRSLGAFTTGTEEGSPNDLAGLHLAMRDTEHLNSENAPKDVPYCSAGLGEWGEQYGCCEQRLRDSPSDGDGARQRALEPNHSF